MKKSLISPGFGSLAWLLALALSLSVAGCKEELPSNEARQSPNHNENNDNNSSSSVELAPCDDNVDCRGGEVCREAFCREACGEGDTCSGPLLACDVDLGYCVECIDDGQCGENRACQDRRCVFFCKDESACEEGEFCNDAGACESAECAVDSDCSGGFRCEDRLCVSIDAQICPPNESRCDGNVAVQCSRDGTREERTECGEELCLLEEGRASCASIICEPNALSCVSENTVGACNNSGTRLFEEACDDNQFCDSGICVNRICEPNSVECDGSALLQCNADGTDMARESCQDECEAEAGCTCNEGACTDRVCVPGTARCVGNAVWPCLDSGLDYGELAQCDGAEVCLAGECVANACTPGETTCAGDTLLTCSNNGTDYTERECQESGRYCDESGTPRCASHVCEPGSRSCSGDLSLRCNERGSGFVEESTENCAEMGLGCHDGICQERCNPGSAVCSGDSRLVCNEDGNAREVIACDAGQFCTEGRCEDQVCTPNQLGCNGNTAALCNARGNNWLPGTDCASQGLTCSEGACIEGSTCPVANARVRVQGGITWVDEIQAAPLETLEFDASESTDAARVEWTIVARPQGSTSTFAPSNNVPSPRLFLDLAGTYIVELRAFDENDEPSCQNDRIAITVAPTEDIHIQFFWDTPGDSNQTDTTGTDMDIHLLNLVGGARWDTPPWDCYWRNPNPDWGNDGSRNGDPSLDLDDTNGAGPEIISLNMPRSDRFRVGVYYFREIGFGPSYATVRIYLRNILAFEYQNKYMEQDGLFWSAGTILWNENNPRVQQVDEIYSGFPTVDP